MDRLPPLRLLVIFEAVARSGSMRNAAARLNVTQPAVTQAIRELEDHVGAKLLDRSTRPARLTEAGEQLARATRDGLGMVGGAIEDIRTRAGNGEQPLTISCTLGMATYWLMPRLPDFYSRHPDLLVNVQVPPTDLPTLLPGIDVALRYGTGNWRDGTTMKLFNEIMYPAARPRVVERLLDSGTGLEGAPLIHVRNLETRNWLGWPDYFARRGLPMPRGPGQTFDNYVQAVQAALDGRGMVLGWRSITDGLVAEGALIPWPDGPVDPGTGYYATHKAGDAAGDALTALIEWLKLHQEPDAAAGIALPAGTA